jgi:3-oxoacyl-(acyl-carrier-protein) synthase
MKQPLYIKSAVAISPQQTFQPATFLKPVMESNTGKLMALDAPYQQYISPVAIRRMSRILKITISAAMEALNQAGIKTPDGIITGTGRGAVTDMEHFVKDMIRLEEGALNPTIFIQSTYNSPNGWIAMQSACTSYNQTYVHRGCSFELALQDTQMMMAEATNTLNVLTGCYDEMTDEYYTIRKKRGYWKEETINSKDLIKQSQTPGTIGGEGAAFFVLSNDPTQATSVITNIEILFAATEYALRDAVLRILEAASLSPNDISFVMTGLNGDEKQSKLYNASLTAFPETVGIGTFKNLSGEYDTAAGFGLWLVNNILANNSISEEIVIRKKGTEMMKHILLINHFILGTASVTLVSKHN